MSTVLSTVVIVLASIVLLLCLRWTVAISGRLNYDEKLVDYSVSGLVGSRRFGVGVKKDQHSFSVYLGGRERKFFSFDLGGEKKTKKPEEPSKKAKPRKRRSINHFAMASSIRRSIRWRGLSLNGEFGFNSPARTGKMFGTLMAIGNGLTSHRFHFNIQPNFNRQMAKISGTTSIQLCPAVLAWRIGKVYFGFNR